MRQFLLGAKLAYPANLTTALSVGQLAFVYLDNGQEKLDTDGTKITGKGYIYLGKDASKGGNVIVPIYKNNFSFTQMDYVAATKFKAEFTLAEVVAGSDYTVVVVKKGVKFNERNKWTSTIRATANDTVTTIIATLAKQINANIGAEVTATAAAGKLTVEAKTAGVGYELALGDDLFGLEVTTTAGIPAIADAAYVADLAKQAAADAGIEYTYQDDVALIYPDYPLNPLKAADSADAGFTIFTIRFAEPREMKTVDQAINQIVQIALPTGAGAIATIKTILTALAA